MTLSEINHILNCKFQSQLNNNYIALFCLHHYADKFYPHQTQLQQQQITNIKIIKRFSTKINSILYQTNLSNIVIINALQYYYQVINKQHRCQKSGNAPVIKFFYKNIQDNLLVTFLVCLMIANKTFDDSSFTSKTWASLSKFPLKKLNLLEIQILGANVLKFDVFHYSFHQQEFKQWAWFLMNQIEVLQKVLVSSSHISASGAELTHKKQQQALTTSTKHKYNSKRLSIKDLVSKDSSVVSASKPVPCYSIHTTPLLSSNYNNGNTINNSAINNNNINNINTLSSYSVTPNSSNHSTSHHQRVSAFPNNIMMDPVVSSPSYARSSVRQFSNPPATTAIKGNTFQLYTPPLNDNYYHNYPSGYAKAATNFLPSFNSTQDNTNAVAAPAPAPTNYNAYPTPEFDLHNCNLISHPANSNNSLFATNAYNNNNNNNTAFPSLPSHVYLTQNKPYQQQQ